jgi:dihydroorotate dehydrogenase subfamily 1
MEELAGFGSLGKEGGLSAERPVLIDRFLADATEVDVDAIRDHTGEVLIGGVMEHVEEAGVHSGDSACAIPPPTLPMGGRGDRVVHRGDRQALDVRGLINVQYAVVGTTVYVIEANPRASRTVPFVAKATGVPLAKVATRVMLGATLAELRAEGLLRRSRPVGHVSVKEAVLPFNRFPEVDPALGPEMRSTGEVMGIADTFGRAFYKAELAAGTILPTEGTVFLSLAEASIWGRSTDDYRRAAEMLADAPQSVVAVEVNISCPNTEHGNELFAHSCPLTTEVIEATAACDRPRWAKLSPNVGPTLVDIADAAQQAGAEAVTVANTYFGLAIDPVTRRPRIGAGLDGRGPGRAGGVSGRAIHPLAVKAVADVRAAHPELPIVAAGGAATVEDVVEFALVGASAVQIGTATFDDPRTCGRLTTDLPRWCARHRVRRFADLIGAADY